MITNEAINKQTDEPTFFFEKKITKLPPYLINNLVRAGKYLMTSWENYADFLEKLGVPLLLRKLATMGTPIVEVCSSCAWS